MAEKIDGESPESELLSAQDFIREGDRLFCQQHSIAAAENYEKVIALNIE